MRPHREGTGPVSAVGAVLCGLVACSDAPKTSSVLSTAQPVGNKELAARAALTAIPLGHVTSRDARGAARVIAGAIASDAPRLDLSGEDAARLHLSRHADVLGLGESVLRSVVLSDAHELAGGAGVYRFVQRVNGIEVFGARASVVLDGSNHLVSIGSSLMPSSMSARLGRLVAFPTSAASALARAYARHAGAPIDESAVRDIGPRGDVARSYLLTTPVAALRELEATAKRVLYPDGDGLVPAYYVELLGRAPGSGVDSAVGYVIGANDGRVLRETSLTQNDAFTYRVWADPSGNHVPTDGPFVDYTPHPTGSPNSARPTFAAPILVSMEGFNKNPQGAADPWLAPDDTFTFGNNVRAYSDRNDYVDDAGSHHNDGYDDGVDIRADVTGAKTFDRVYDVTKAPNVNSDQIKAAVTQIFYVTNWLHDYWYDSGFDEKSGVAQLSNYGRGGVEGDPLRAEAQDEANGGQANNANMSTLSDGTSPRMQMYVWNGNPLRDGTIDNSVVAHEWGHYLHHRLVFCGSPSCDGMSEGWADFDALLMVIKDGDTFEAGKVYPLAQYATSGLVLPTGPLNYPYFGIRRAPYSTDMTKNPFTFKHVRKAATLPTTAPLALAAPDMNEPHNVGEIWASALFEGYVNLINAGKAAGRTFDVSKRRMADYVVAGMKATPPEPTFVEQRDAILSTVLATGRMDDFTALAQGFAKRGLGAGAIAPPTTSTTLNEAVENFDFKGNLVFLDARVDDSVRSCDRDGYLDASEAGKLSIDVKNDGWLTLTKTQVKVTTQDPNVTFNNGGVITLPSLAPYQAVPVSIGVTAASTATKRSVIPITITLSDPDSSTPTFDTAFQTLYNLDDKPASSATDDVESDHPAWTPTPGPKPLPITAWSRQGSAANHFWHGDDLGAVGDEALVSPALAVSTTAPFTIAFSHRYSFEVGPVTPLGPDAYFDGGVLEVSEDGGSTWNDVSTYANPNYPRTLYASSTPNDPSANPLAGRKAWAGQSAGYPTMVKLSLNLGTALAGKTLKVRFRIGTDGGSGDAGWDVDDIAFGGITNTPFASLVDDTTAACGDAGVPNPTDGGAGTPDANSTGAGGSRNDGGVTSGAGGSATGTATTGVTTTGGATTGAGTGGARGTGSGAGSAGGDAGCSCSTLGGSTLGGFSGRRWARALAMLGALAFARRRHRA
jgi:hypothetical protein